MRENTRKCNSMLSADKEDIFVVKDELLIKRIDNKNRNNEIIEIDNINLDTYVWDKKHNRKIQPKLCLLLSKKSKKILEYRIIGEEENEIEEIYKLTIKYMQMKGKPKIIIVRNKYIYNKLINLCRELGVFIEISIRLEDIDDFIRCGTHSSASDIY